MGLVIAENLLINCFRIFWREGGGCGAPFTKFTVYFIQSLITPEPTKCGVGITICSMQLGKKSVT